MGVRHTESSLIVWSGASLKDTSEAQKAEPVKPLFSADQYYDAGDTSCAFGPMDEIAAIIQQMQSGQTLEVHATDHTVSIDISAWCRMTGNQLVEQQGSHYLIRRK